jgi:signal transduction histidine kinase
VIREITDGLSFFLCQTATWQAVVLAEDELSAASKSIEQAMNESSKKGLAALILVKKISEDLTEKVFESQTFFTPMILADAGFHNEAITLIEFLEKIKNEQQE